MYKVEAVHKNKAIDLHKQGNQNRVEYPVFLWVPLVQLAFNILSYRYLLKMWKDEKLLIWNDFDMILTPVFFKGSDEADLVPAREANVKCPQTVIKGGF